MATTVQSNNLLLPMDIQQKLQELELELAEGIILIYFRFIEKLFFVSLGDITQKGFEKKRVKLLASYHQQHTSNGKYLYRKKGRKVYF
jgi:hypothetical protein